MQWEKHSRQYEIYGNIFVLYNGEKQRNCFVLSSSTFAQSDVVCWWSSFSKKSARIGHVVGWRSRQLPSTNRVFLFPHFFKVDCFPQSSVMSIHLHHFNRNRLAGQLSRQSNLVANFPRVFFTQSWVRLLFGSVRIVSEFPRDGVEKSQLCHLYIQFSVRTCICVN